MYLFHFSKRLPILFPLTLMLASIRLLSQTSQNNEMIALLTGGLPRAKLLRPLFVVALCITGISYVNTEFFQPKALAYLEPSDSKKTLLSSQASVHGLPTTNSGPIVYQQYFSEKKELFDVWWLKTPNELIRMKRLYPFEETPKGELVDFLERNIEGTLEKTTSKETFLFPDLIVDTDTLEIDAQPAETLALSTLFVYGNKGTPDQKAMLWSWFWYKLLIPLICLLATLAPAPYCMRFERNLKIFLIYALGLFLLLSLFTILDAALIIAEHQILPSYIAIATPILIFALFFAWKWKKS